MADTESKNGMTRNDRLHKLGNAIREYRGAKGVHGKWIRPPNPGAQARVERWLAELGLDVTTHMAAIDGFKTREEFDAWMRSL